MNDVRRCESAEREAEYDEEERRPATSHLFSPFLNAKLSSSSPVSQGN